MAELQARQKSSMGGESSISSMALRTVISNVEATLSIAQILGKILLPSLYEDNQTIDSMDVLIDLIKRFGSSFTEEQVGDTEKVLLEIMKNNARIVSKRAVVATGLLARYLSGNQWDALCGYIVQGFSQDREWNKTLVLLCCTLAKAESVRFRPFLPSIFSKIYENLLIDELGDEDDDHQESLELREATLQTLEVFAQLGETSIEKFINQLIQAVSVFATFDPNYLSGNEGESEDEDQDMDNSMEEDDDDDFELSDQGFSDDEDQSWKLRRRAARLASAMINEVSTWLPHVFSQLFPLLISRLSAEREDVVKQEVIDAISAFISAVSPSSLYYASKQGRPRSSDASMLSDGDPKAFLQEKISKLVSISLKELSNISSIQIVHGLLGKVLSELVVVLNGIPTELDRIIPVLDTLSKSKSFLMSDILNLTQAILLHHSTEILTPHLIALTDIIVHGMNDHYYKTSSQALTVSLHLFTLYKTGDANAGAVERVEDTIISRATSTNLDTETREVAVRALGKLIYHAPLSQGDFERGCNAILDMLWNESLRLDSIGAVEDIAYSNGRPTSQWLSQSIEKICGFLRMSSRPLRLASLKALLALSSRVDQITASQNRAVPLLTMEVLNHGSELLQLSDGQSLALVVSILSRTNVTDPAVESFALEIVRRDTTYPAAEPAILELFKAIINASDKTSCESLYQSLATPLKWLELQAKLVALLVVYGGLGSKVQEYEHIIEQNSDASLLWPLMVYGNIGRMEKLGRPLDFLYDRLAVVRDEAVRLALADTIALIASNNAVLYLPLLIEKFKADPETAALNLTAVREVIMNENLDAAAQSQLWDQLLEFDSRVQDDGERDIIAECVGRLSILDPVKFLPQLQKLLSSDQSSVREIVVSAVKYSFGQAHDRYDDLLRPIVVDFLALVEDEELKIRQVALNALVSAIHNKYHLLIPHLSRLLPLLFKETAVDPSLIETVQMGPFKHKVDGGLDLRKTAYETIYTLVSTLPTKLLQNFGMLDVLFERVIAGLSDEHDIRVLSCVIIGRLANVDFSIVSTSGHLDQVISKFSGLLGVTVKENAIKQEFEKHNEIVRNVHRASVQIDRAIRQRLNNGEPTGLSDVELAKWDTFYKQIEQSRSKSKFLN